MPTPSAVDSARHLDQIGWSLSRAGISSGAWLLARASYSAPAASKKFTLVVNGENEYGEIMPKNLDITISTLEELKEVKYDNGKGNLATPLNARLERDPTGSILRSSTTTVPCLICYRIIPLGSYARGHYRRWGGGATKAFVSGTGRPNEI